MKWIIAVFLLIPFIATIVIRVVLFKIGFTKKQSTTVAFYVTTLLLLITIPTLIESIWRVSVVFIFIMTLLVIAIILTFIEWRSSKEIDVTLLLKKIWKYYFVLLSLSYIVILIVGFVYWMYTYMTN